MPDSQSPTIHQRRLRVELRRERDRAQLTQEEVARSLEWSISKMIRIEAGTVNVSTTDLRALLQLYGSDAERVKEVTALAHASRERAWWTGYKKIFSQQYLDLIGYESGVSAFRQFHPTLVPGLLQTPEYARAVISGLRTSGDSVNIDTQIEVRLRRQEILEQERPPLFFFILDEAVVSRQVESRQVMRRQLRHLLQMTERPSVTIEIVPFSAGVHPGMTGPLLILEFPNAEDDDVLFLENPRGDWISREVHDEVVRYREIFERLRELSLKPEGSAALLSRLVDEMG